MRLIISRLVGSAFTGTSEEMLQQTRQVRDEIEQQIKSFVQEASSLSYWIPTAQPAH